jgi:hypothetical protein
MRLVLLLALIWCLILNVQCVGVGTDRLVVTFSIGWMLLGLLGFLEQCRLRMDSLWSNSMGDALCCGLPTQLQLNRMGQG